MFTRIKSVNALLTDISKELADNNIILSITKFKMVYAMDGTGGCYGLFIPPEKGKPGYIRVASRGHSLPEVLLGVVHEYIHWRQWYNNEKIYKSNDYYKLECNTERRALTFLKRSTHNIPKKIIKEAEISSKKYLKEISEEIQKEWCTNLLS
jgi:hypothetical protein